MLLQFPRHWSLNTVNPLGVVFTVLNPSRPRCSHALLYPYPIDNNVLATACERLFSTCIVCTRLAASHLCLAPVSSCLICMSWLSVPRAQNYIALGRGSHIHKSQTPVGGWVRGKFSQKVTLCKN